MKLLHVDSSALGEASVTRELGRALVDAWVRSHPDSTVVHRDLAASPLAHWAPAADPSDPAARDGERLLEEFLAADVVVVGAPMVNFSIPSTLKAWIDRIVVAGRTFRYAADGPEGLAGGKRLIIVSARGGVYSEAPADAMDFQERYLRAVFGFIGVTDIEIMRAEGLKMSPAHREHALAAAHEAIRGHGRIAA